MTWLALPLGVGAGCRVDDCVFAHFTADMPVTVRHGGRTTTELLAGGVAPQNVGPRVFAVIEQTLLTDASSFDVIIWTIDGTFGDLGWGALSLAVPTPLTQGAERTIDTAFSQTGWGESLLPPGSQGAVSLRLGYFDAVDAAGTVSVTRKAPLVLPIDLTLIGAAGDSIAVVGALTIRHHPETGSCEGIAQRIAAW